MRLLSVCSPRGHSLMKIKCESKNLGEEKKYWKGFSFVKKKNIYPYACRDSNSGFPACEAGVMTRLDHTRPVRSPTGTRTRVAWVKTMYPDQLDYWGELRNGESNPGHLRDRQRCYQLHHIGWCTAGVFAVQESRHIFFGGWNFFFVTN